MRINGVEPPVCREDKARVLQGGGGQNGSATV